MSLSSPTRGQPAGYLARLAARIIDELLAFAFAFPAAWGGYWAFSSQYEVVVVPRELAALVCWALGYLFTSFAYYVLFQSVVGWTLGKRVMRIKVIRRDGLRIGLWTASLRWFGYFVSWFTLGFGCLCVLWKPGRPAHDLLAGTQVVDAE